MLPDDIAGPLNFDSEREWWVLNNTFWGLIMDHWTDDEMAQIVLDETAWMKELNRAEKHFNQGTEDDYKWS